MPDPSSTDLDGSFKPPRDGQASSLGDRIKKLRDAYRIKLPDKVLEMQQAARDAEAGGWTAGLLEKLYQLAHRLHGSAATFGFSKMGGAASALEKRCKTLIAQGAPPAAEDIDAIDGCIQDMQREAANSPDESAAPAIGAS